MTSQYLVQCRSQVSFFPYPQKNNLRVPPPLLQENVFRCRLDPSFCDVIKSDVTLNVVDNSVASPPLGNTLE